MSAASGLAVLFDALAMGQRICSLPPRRRITFHLYAAKNAKAKLNYHVLNGKAIRIMWANKNARTRADKSGNIFIKVRWFDICTTSCRIWRCLSSSTPWWTSVSAALDISPVAHCILQNFEKSITTRELHDTFSDFGDILSCKVAVDKDGNSKGYGFVHFAEPSSAKAAIDAVNGAQLGESDKVVSVTEFVSKQERGDPKQHFTNIYVKNLPETIKTEDDVKAMFSEYGDISSVALMKVSTSPDILTQCVHP